VIHVGALRLSTIPNAGVLKFKLEVFSNHNFWRDRRNRIQLLIKLLMSKWF